MKKPIHFTDSDAAYRRLGPLKDPHMACTSRTDMDGVPVTIFYVRRGKDATTHGICRPQFSMKPFEAFRCYTSSRHEFPDGLYRWDDEGITWIRGFHAPDSPEVAALLVAHSIGRTEA